MLISKGFKQCRQHFREPLVYMYIIVYADIQFLRFMVYFMSGASPERKQIHPSFHFGCNHDFGEARNVLGQYIKWIEPGN